MGAGNNVKTAAAIARSILTGNMAANSALSDAEKNAIATLALSAPSMLSALEKAAQRITQLCEMVNTRSGALGLGRKVHAGDFLEGIPEAIRQAKGEG